MKLLELHATGVRGVPDGAYSFTDPHTRAPLGVVLITGDAASGKTSLLEAIAAAKEAIGAYGGPPDARRLRRTGAEESCVTTTWLLSDLELEHAHLDEARQTVTWDLTAASSRTDAAVGLRRLFASYSRADGLGKVEYFPTNRRLVQPARGAFGRPNRDAEVRGRLTRAADKYSCILDGLRELALDEATRAVRALREGGPREDRSGAFEPFEQAIAAVLPHLRLAGFDLGDGGGLRFSRRAGEVVALDDLSDSEHQGVLFALAFAYFGLSGSIILIDEPELHMHATARVRFLETLAALGRDNQILAATGAAELVSAAKPGHVIELSRRTATSAATNRPPEQSASRGVAEAPASPMPMLDPGTAEPATSSKPARVERPAPQDVPSYLRPLPIGGALSPAPPVFPPSPQQDNDGHGTMLTSAVSGPALPFVQPPPRGEDDGYETVQLEVGALGPALPFAPPGKRLARFDPQTGRALPEPIWVDLPGNER